MPSLVSRSYGLSALRVLVAMVAAAPLWGQTPPSFPAAPSQATTRTPLVVRGVTVIDVRDGQRLRDQTVVIAGNRIRAMGVMKKVTVPTGAQVVDGRGKYLIPGLWDMHVHLLAFPDILYRLLLANGVTGIRDMGTGIFLDTLHQWHREILAGTRIGPPRQLFAGPMLDETSSSDQVVHCWRPCFHGNDPSLVVRGRAHVRHLVDSLHAAGADFIKVHGITLRTYWALVDEARRVGIPVAGHLPENRRNEADKDSIGGSDPGGDSLDLVLAVSDSGQRTIEHTYGLDGRCIGDSATVERCRPIAERHRRNGTWDVLSPTLGVPTRATTQDILRRLEFWPYSHKALPVSNLDSVLDRPGTLQEVKGWHLEMAERAGLPLLVGTDIWGLPWWSLPGVTLHDDLAIYVAAGLSPLTVLQAVTINPARFLGATDSLGTVAPGKVADLVLLDADPLTDIWNTTTIRAVVANGRYFDRAALDGLLAEARTRAQAQRAASAEAPKKP